VAGLRSHCGCQICVRIDKVPRYQVSVTAQVLDDVPVERAGLGMLPAGWDSSDRVIARSYGDCWISEARTAVLLTPSVVARQVECDGQPAHLNGAASW
jgi:hypothetical protein